MGICFLRGENYREFLRRRAPNGIRPGEIVDRNGKRIGTHDGCAFYTVGQKRGLGLPPSLAVVAIDAARNRLIAGEDEELRRRRLTIRAWNVPDMERLCRSRELRVVIRGIGRNPDGFAHVRPERDRLHVELEYPAWAPAPDSRSSSTNGTSCWAAAFWRAADRTVPLISAIKATEPGSRPTKICARGRRDKVLDARRVTTRMKGRTAACPECAKNGALFYLSYRLSSLFPQYFRVPRMPPPTRESSRQA